MTASPHFILVVDDEEGLRAFLRAALTRSGYEVETLKSGAEAIRRLDSEQRMPDLVITDLAMPGVDGLEVMRHIKTLPVPPAVLMITAFASTDTAVEAMALGAADYLIKPFKVDELRIVVERTLAQRELVSENHRLRDQLRSIQTLNGMLARSPAMHRVFELIRRAAPTKANVLIRGESGVGKELVARALHHESGRSGPFVAVNCGALPAALMESELFGHVKGAFTGATSDAKGMIAAASGGTLFLDEIGELGPALQVKLLRALQERTYRPVGGTTELAADCRFVAATNVDLEAAVEAGEFRKDLYFRLNVVQIVVPPLRHRKEDLPPLIERFFQRACQEMGRVLEGISAPAMASLLAYDYPGNVRELENALERAVALEGGTLLSADNLFDGSALRLDVSGQQGGSRPDEFPESGLSLDGRLEDLERALINGALARAGGVRKRAAELLGVSMRSLRYRMQKLGMEPGGDDGALA